jgi:cytochrome c-type biogenesis protein CcsB
MMKFFPLFFALLALYLPHTLLGAPPLSGALYCQPEQLKDFAIQQNGRIKPLIVHAEETLKLLVNKKNWEGLSALQVYCELSLSALGVKISFPELSTVIAHEETRKLLLADNEHQYQIPLNELLQKESEIRLAWQKEKLQNSYKKDLSQLLNRLSLYRSVIEGQDWTFYEAPNWTPLAAYLTEERSRNFAEAQGLSDLTAVLQGVMNQSHQAFIASGQSVQKELILHHLHLATVSMVLSLLALAFLVGAKNKMFGLSLAGLTAITQMVLMIFRIAISGRAPITNMYETVLFSGWGALVLSLAIGHFRKDTLFVIGGLAYNICTLMMMNFATGMLNAAISPLVPVLRDNFWLSTHVTTIILSYGALALSWILANITLFKQRFSKTWSMEQTRYSMDVIYTCLKFGTVLLGTGIILGGVWADYSWGRFWGWDPKETWSLIVFVLYMAILHGKSTAWIPPKRFIPLVAGAFMSVMMAWFGVNYILATGLHSYGFSEGGAIFLGSFFAGQILILIITHDFNKAPMKQA